MQVIGKSSEFGMKQQRGGTLLGLIIGGLLGLGIALTVAVYVTKVPVPFMNKSPAYNPDSDAAESKKNKDWNPNAPLAGKNPARPSATVTPSASGELTLPEPEVSFSVPEPATPLPSGAPPERAAKAPRPAATVATPTPAPVPARPRDPATASVPAPATAPAKPRDTVVASVAPPTTVPALIPKPKPPVSGDPLGDLAKSRSDRPESPVFSSGADPFNYFIQAGAYRTPEDAEQQRARLLLLGMQARVTEREQAGRTVYRVRVGPFDKKDDADKVKDRLDNNSIETALVRVQR
ncbi:MAG: Sporulation domain protein [Polaromonas sp.]|nr:Sporulation domain protein [Polaromonas sp.]